MKKNIKLILLIAVVAVAAADLVFVFKDALFSIPAEGTYSFINPDESLAETDEGMQIDGVLDESVYSQNTWTYLRNANGGNTVDIAITSWFGEKGIYFAYEVRENTPIYVNMDRASWMNSCIEMYLVPSDVQSMPSENVFEIDLLPTGYLLFKRPNAAGGWSDVTTTNDKMAYLGATTHGGQVNTEDCTGYNLELFIPYDYLEYLGVDSQLVKNGYVNVNPCHITSYNETGIDGSVDRFWYSFARQLGGDGWNDINRFFKFNKDGAMGTVKNEFAEARNCTLSGNPTAIPGLDTTVTITPDAGYAISSIQCNGQELIRYVNYNEDGSAVLTLPADNDGMRFTAKAEKITEGNKTLMGVVELKNIFGDTLEGVSASYEDASGEHKLEFAEDGSFVLADMPQGYYVIRVKKDGYLKAERTLCVNRNMDIAVEVSYDLFETESGNCWNVSDANQGVLTKINGTGAILTKDLFADFYIEADIAYSQELSQEFVGDDYQQQRMGVRVKFDNGKYWHIDLLRQNDGKYHLQFGKIMGEGSLFNWDLVHELTEDQIARYQSDGGIKLGVLRTGRTAYIYLDNQFVGQADLGEAQAKCKAQVGFESFVANAKVMTIPYDLDIAAPAAVVLTDSGSVGAKVSLNGAYQVGQDAVVLIQKTTSEAGAKLLSVQVNGKEMAQDVIATAGGYRLVIPNSLDKVLSVKAVYAKPALTTAVIDTLDVDADGISVRLLQDGAVQGTAVVNNGKAVFSDVYTGVYQVQARIYNVWTTLDWVTVLGEDVVTADIKALFETPDNTNYTGNMTFKGTETKHYSIATDIAGDAWFTMKVQLDKAQLEAVAANKDNIRLGYRMFFGGYEGNYEWDNEYEITLKYTAEGQWVFEQMQTWERYEIPAEMIDALTAEGVYLALNRDAQSGALTLYYGSTEAQLQAGKYMCKWETAAEKQREYIKRFGVGFWSEKGSNYKATVSDLRYGTGLSEILGIETVSASLQLSGHKDGSYHLLPEGTQVLLQSAVGNYELAVDTAGKISGQVLPGVYTVCADGYVEAEVEISESGLQGQLALEYDLFNNPTGWDTEKHDLSEVNDSKPQISMNTQNTDTDPTATLEGKYVSILGDSISTYEGICNDVTANTTIGNNIAWYNGLWPSVLNGPDQTYWGKVMNQYGMKLLVNNSCGGNRLFDASGTDVTVAAGYVRVEELAANTGVLKGTKPDYILMFMGTNDYIAGIPLGELKDSTYEDVISGTGYKTPTTFTEAYIITLEKARVLYPNAQVLCFTLIPSSYNTDWTVLDAYNERIRQIAAHYDQVTLVDIAADSGITTGNYMEYTFDGTHPNAKGIDLIARVLENALENAAYQAAGQKKVNGGTMNVITNDSFGEVSASLWVKEDNSTHSAHTQGIWIRFEDGKYMILYQEDEKLLYMKQLWDFETVQNSQKEICTRLPEDIVYKWKLDGYKLTLLRKANQLYVTADGQLLHVETLPDAYADDQVEVGFFAYDSASSAAWDFEILSEFDAFKVVCGDSENGTVTADKNHAQLGETVTLTVTPESGYVLKSLKVNGMERIGEVTDGTLTVIMVNDITVEATFVSMYVDALIVPNISVEDGTAIRLLQDGRIKAEGTFTNNRASVKNISSGVYDAQIRVFNYWAKLGTLEILSSDAVEADVASLFENPGFADFDGNIQFSGTASKHASVAADISGDAWFVMKVQVDKTQLEAVEANKNLVRLGFRLFFGGEPGNYLWENEYEPTLKYTADGRWVIEQMQSWEGWDNYLPEDMANALTGEGLYLALHRNAQTGVLTMYYGATQVQIVAGTNSFQWTSAAAKQTESITRFGAGFWSENGTDYLATVTNLCYGAALEEVLDTVDVTITTDTEGVSSLPIRLTQNGQEKAVGTMENGQAVFTGLDKGSYQVEVKIFNAWSPVATVTPEEQKRIAIDVLSVFENAGFADFDGNIQFAGIATKHCSVATDISGDAWFAMKVQVDKTQLDAVAANKGNIRLGYRMFFGGEPGNYLWENEYELTLKYTQSGWILEQMNTWEGWDRTLSQEAADALTGDGLYLALHRNAQTGVLTLYYGAALDEIVAGTNSFTYTQATEKHKETITRFGAGFWSENGSDYTAAVIGLRYGATLEEALQAG